MLIIQFKHKTCSVLYLTTLNVPEIYMQLLSIGNAVGVYIFPQILILHTKRFFAHQLKGKPKNQPEFQRYCNICNYNIYASRFLYSKQPCLFMDR